MMSAHTRYLFTASREELQNCRDEMIKDKNKTRNKRALRRKARGIRRLNKWIYVRFEHAEFQLVIEHHWEDARRVRECLFPTGAPSV